MHSSIHSPAEYVRMFDAMICSEQNNTNTIMQLVFKLPILRIKVLIGIAL